MRKIRDYLREKKDYLETSWDFFKDTRLYPLFRKHYYCIVWDWVREEKVKAWYIKNKKGKMIPWVHFRNGVMCCYEDQIIKKL